MKKTKRTLNKNNIMITHFKKHEHLTYINYHVKSLLSLTHPISKSLRQPILRPASHHVGRWGVTPLMSSVPTSHHVGRWGWEVTQLMSSVPTSHHVGRWGWEVTQLMSSVPTSHHVGRWGWEVTQLMSSVPTLRQIPRLWMCFLRTKYVNAHNAFRVSIHNQWVIKGISKHVFLR